MKQGLWAASLPSGSRSYITLPGSLLTFPASPPPRSSHHRLSNFQTLFWIQIPFRFLSLGNLCLYFQLCGFNFLLFFHTEFLCVVCPSYRRQHWVTLKVSTALVIICLPLLATAHKSGRKSLLGSGCLSQSHSTMCKALICFGLCPAVRHSTSQTALTSF